jgi:hypothetical protein
VLRINIDIGCLQTAKNYLYILVGIVYCVQVLALEKLLLEGQRNTQTEEDCNSFLAMQHKQLADSTFSLISEIISILAYSKHIRLTAGNLGNTY